MIRVINNRPIVCILLGVVLLSVGCSTTHRGRIHKHVAGHFKCSNYKDPLIKNTIKDPVFLALVAAGGLSFIEKHETQDWFSDHEYFSGSNGEDTGDDLFRALIITSTFGVPLAQTIIANRTNGNCITEEDWMNFSGGVVVAGEAQLLAWGLTEATKYAAHVERPDGSNHRSFPSGHSSGSFVSAALMDRALAGEIKINDWDPRWRYLSIIPYTTASYVAVSRIEHDKHFLPDVLFGAALGRFMGNFIYDLHYDVPDSPKDTYKSDAIGRRKEMFRLESHLIPVIQPDHIGIYYSARF